MDKAKVVNELVSAEDAKWLTCNGQQLIGMVGAGLASLEQNHQTVNDLNVFPVPDGDTGTNMLLTMRSAYRGIQGNQERNAGKVMQELSHGALMGARGNSGVILSQIFRGLAKGLTDIEQFNAADLARAMKDASDTAYKGVMRPVEGTILTVIREGAEEAADAASKSQDLRFILERIIERCQQALERTPEMLPVLKEAGVVDAGGMGLVVILEGMLRSVQGEKLVVSERQVAPELSPQAKAAPAGGLEYPYDVQFILMGSGLDLHSVREAIDKMGDSTVVVGDERAIKVHVHVKDPGTPISYGISQGLITDVVVENMQLQMEEIINHPRAPAQMPSRPEVNLQPGQVAVVAVASGDGLAGIFYSLGAAAVVSGGQSNNPSTEEILKAVEEVPLDQVIILPNNKNIILAAEAARELSSKDVRVVPSRAIPQGISALLAVNQDASLEEVTAAMHSAINQVASGEITVATRAANLDGITVAEGELIGVAEGRLCAASSDMAEIVGRVLAAMDAEQRELVSIYYGQDTSEKEAQEVASCVESLYPDLEVEILAGGQAIYRYIIGAE